VPSYVQARRSRHRYWACFCTIGQLAFRVSLLSSGTWISSLHRCVPREVLVWHSRLLLGKHFIEHAVDTFDLGDIDPNSIRIENSCEPFETPTGQATGLNCDDEQGKFVIFPAQYAVPALADAARIRGTVRPAVTFLRRNLMCLRRKLATCGTNSF